MNTNEFIAQFKKLPTWKQITYIVLAAVAMTVAVLGTSCSRSSYMFKGQGEMEYYYNGKESPAFVHPEYQDR